MTAIEKKAEECVEAMSVLYGTDHVKAIPWKDIFEALLKILIPMLGGCFASPKPVMSVLNNPGPFQRRRMKRVIAEQESVPADKRDVVYQVLLDVGHGTSEDETKAMLAGK